MPEERDARRRPPLITQVPLSPGDLLRRKHLAPKSRPLRSLTAAAAAALLTVLSGCAVHTHPTQVFTTQGPAEAPEAASAPAPVDRFTLLREAADHEALYTLAGGLKPMSTGFWSGTIDLDAPDLTELRAVREAIEPLRNATWYADVQVFANAHEGQRFAHAYVVHRAALERMLEHYGDFWAPWGIAPDTHPAEVMAVVDRMPKGDRWRGFGYLFGFPPESVEFFVEAGLARAENSTARPPEDRRFLQIPTFGAETGRFTYAVPVGHRHSAADDALADQAGRILDAYRSVRGRVRSPSALVAELQRLDRRFEADAREAGAIRDARLAARPTAPR